MPASMSGVDTQSASAMEFTFAPRRCHQRASRHPGAGVSAQGRLGAHRRRAPLSVQGGSVSGTPNRRALVWRDGGARAERPTGVSLHMVERGMIPRPRSRTSSRGRGRHGHARSPGHTAPFRDFTIEAIDVHARQRRTTPRTHRRRGNLRPARLLHRTLESTSVGSKSKPGRGPSPGCRSLIVRTAGQ
jgi:hypothetical protein